MPHKGAFDFLAERGIVFASLRHRLSSIKKSNAGLRLCHFFLLSLWDYFMIPFGGSSGSKAMPLCGIGFFCFEYSLEPSVQTRTKQKKPAHCAGF
jgi:hypothetical protein